MWPFPQKYKTLSHAVRDGDVRAARKMLDRGSDPNKGDPDDNAYPIHYALNHGPEMVQLLVDHGANVNIPSPSADAMPLALAEFLGHMEVASILRGAGARLYTGTEEFSMDPRFRLQIETKIVLHVLAEQLLFPTENPDTIAERVEEKLNVELPKNMTPQEQEEIRKEIRALIKKKCGVKDYLRGEEKPIPSPKEVMAKTGMSEDDLTRRFMEHLIQQGKNPFKEMPGQMLRDAEGKFPDLAELARRKFGTSQQNEVPSMSEKKHVPRTCENIPSMVMLPVPESFSYSSLVTLITDQADDKQLVCLIQLGWTISEEDAARHIQLRYEFADDPMLVLMRFLSPIPGQEQIIIRASFMRDTASKVTASNLCDLTERLSQLARERGLNTTTRE